MTAVDLICYDFLICDVFGGLICIEFRFEFEIYACAYIEHIQRMTSLVESTARLCFEFESSWMEHSTVDLQYSFSDSASVIIELESKGGDTKVAFPSNGSVVV